MDEGIAKERETEEDEERGKNESSRLGEGRLFVLGVNIIAVLYSRTQLERHCCSHLVIQNTKTHTDSKWTSIQVRNPFQFLDGLLCRRQKSRFCSPVCLRQTCSSLWY